MLKPTTPFVEFPKISRWSRGVIVTEKIDGTNAQICIPEYGACTCEGIAADAMGAAKCGGIHAGSRNKWISPTDDNMGFANWVQKNRDELVAKLGPGNHFGEWWGSGIQRGYGLKEKRFSLFNVSRWGDEKVRPSCCGVVPTLWAGPMDELDVNEIMRKLEANGSYAAPGFKKPEGIVIFCTAGGQLFKKTFEKDGEGKGK